MGVMRPRIRNEYVGMSMKAPAAPAMPQERSFDEFHLYTLPRTVTVRDGELKQVEFLRAYGVKGVRKYTYNPAVHIGFNRSNYDPDYGLTDSKKVGIRIEIANKEENKLGVPLPKGRMRLYRTDDVDGRREFTGENTMDHLAKNETLKLDMGFAFDLVGERKRTDFVANVRQYMIDETFEITLRNHKSVPVEIRVVEPLYRCSSWEIRDATWAYEKINSNTIEFVVPVPADGEKTFRYTVHYWW